MHVPIQLTDLDLVPITDLVHMLKDEIENHLSIARVPFTVADVNQPHNVWVAVFA